ncbi:MAG: hypothetical protein ACRCWI_05395 [Brevinema sp.]
MKKYILSICFLLSACAIEGEVFRLQTRLDAWYQLLTEPENLLFAQNKIIELGLSIDQKEQENEVFQKQLRAIRIKEAIMSFDGEQTTHFFYNILLQDLAKFSYEEFLNSLSTQEQIEFITNKIFTPNTKQDKVFRNAKKNYGFQHFSDQQIINYYRTVSFPANFYPLVYDVLAFLARYRSMDSFLQGDMPLEVFDDIEALKKSKRIPLRTQGEKDHNLWQELKQRSHLTNLSNQEFLGILRATLSELDESVRIGTIENIRERFKEQ